VKNNPAHAAVKKNKPTVTKKMYRDNHKKIPKLADRASFFFAWKAE